MFPCKSQRLTETTTPAATTTGSSREQWGFNYWHHAATVVHPPSASNGWSPECKTHTCPVHTGLWAGSCTSYVLQIWDKQSPISQPQVEQPGKGASMSAWYHVLQVPLNWGTASVLQILTSPVITWPNHLPTQLLLSRNQPQYYVRGHLSVTLCLILCAAWAIQPTCTCFEDHLFALTLCIILPGLKAVLASNGLFLPHLFCLLSLYSMDQTCSPSLHQKLKRSDFETHRVTNIGPESFPIQNNAVIVRGKCAEHRTHPETTCRIITI